MKNKMKKAAVCLITATMFAQCLAVAVFASDNKKIEIEKNVTEEYDKETHDALEHFENAGKSFICLFEENETTKNMDVIERERKMLESARDIRDAVREGVNALWNAELAFINLKFTDDSGEYVPEDKYDAYTEVYDKSDKFFSDLWDEAGEYGVSLCVAITYAFDDGIIDTDERFDISGKFSALIGILSNANDSPYLLSLKDDSKTFDIEIYYDKFPSEDRLGFCIYNTIQDVAESFDWYVTQNNNPEISFDVDKQELESANLYLDYFADCTKDEARKTIDEYSDTVTDAIQYAFPSIQIDKLTLFWRVPSIDEDNLYAAMIFFENNGDGIERTGEHGLIY